MAVEQFRADKFQGDDPNDPYAGTGLPELGLRNYWYPVMAAWRPMPALITRSEWPLTHREIFLSRIIIIKAFARWV